MNRDDWERIVCAEQGGLYESNYLKANSPDGQWGLWIKHNLLRPAKGPALAEFWFILSSPDAMPVVAKKEVPFEHIQVSPDAVAIRSDTVQLSPTSASGSLADIQWSLQLSGADHPLLHFPWDWMYTAPFPKKKAITPAPHLCFNGRIQIGDKTIEVDGWEGLRGHNWGKEHAWSYAYGNCHLWKDNHRRTFDAFSAKIRLPGGLKSPWLSTAIARNPDHNFNRPVHWFDRVSLTPTSWILHGTDHRLQMTTTPAHMVGLRYAHPDGTESYCYNTKFASVLWEVGGSTFESDNGEFESLFPDPVDDIPLHPDPNWDPTQGDYRA